MRKIFTRFSIVALVATMCFAACEVDTPPTDNPTPDDPGKEEPKPEPEPEPEGDFLLEIEEMDGTSCISKVTPKDKEMYYVLYKAPVQYFLDCEVTNDEELFENDMFYYKRGAAYNGQTLKEYLESWNMLFKGNMRGRWPDLVPGQTHILYVYGIEFDESFEDCTRLTNIYWLPITPPVAELRDDIDFEVECSVKGANVTLDVDPKEWDGYYTVQIFDANEELYYDASQGVTDEYVASVGAGWVTMFNNNLEGGASVQQILDYTSHKGAKQHHWELGSYVLYTALVYAVEEVDGYYQMVSKPKVINFSTEEVKPSDMTIDLAVENLYVRVCDLVVTPSVDDETYAMLLMPTEYLEEGYTDEKLINLALGSYSYYTNILRGVATSHVSNLYPETEYILFAFGYSGGVVTTPLFKNIFTTEAEGECELSITDVKYGGPYVPSEVKALDPERFYNVAEGVDDYMFLVWTEIETDKPTNDEFVYVIDNYTYDYYGYDTIFFDLLISTCDTVETSVLQYGFDYYICAAAFDYKGNVTPMWRSELITWTKEDAQPAQELIDKLNSSTRAQLMMVDKRTGAVIPARK